MDLSGARAGGKRHGQRGVLAAGGKRESPERGKHGAEGRIPVVVIRDLRRTRIVHLQTRIGEGTGHAETRKGGSDRADEQTLARGALNYESSREHSGARGKI